MLEYYVKQLVGNISHYNNLITRRNSHSILEELLRYVRSGGDIAKHPDYKYYTNKKNNIEYQPENSAKLIKSIKYYIDLSEIR